MLGLYITLGILGFIIVLLLIWLIAGFNGLVRKRNRVENGFSQIDIQCKKRFDLVPNLVEVVKGYANHEKQTLESVIAARNMGASAHGAAQLASADNSLTQTLSRLFALTEAYPQLKANTNFIKLQDELIALEKSIAHMRGFYNDAVMMYNNAIMVFPKKIIANMFKFKKAAFFNASDTERQNVSVNMSK